MEVLNITINITHVLDRTPDGNGSLNDTLGQSASQLPCAGSVFFFIIYGPMWGIVCIFGLIGNSLAFIVLHKFSKNNVATFLLKTLSITDNLFLLTALVIQMYPAMVLSFGLEEHLIPIYPYLQTYAWPLAHMSQMGTVWMTVLVATNRYIAVCHPLQAPRLCTKHKVKVQITIMTISIIIYNIPRYLEHHYIFKNVTTSENTTNEMEVNIGLASHQLYNIIYENVSYMLFLFLIPLLILIVLNAHLVKELKAAQKSREALTSRTTNDENNITLVMIVIILVFIVCQTPASINQILFYIVSDEEKSKCSHYIKYYHISNLLLVMNSSVNFVIYCMFRRQFQQDVCALLCGKERQPRHGSSVRRINSSSYRNSTGRSTYTTQESLPLTPNMTDSKDATSEPNSHNGYKKRWT